ncbi:hypothetical protein [Myxococcus sp. AB036A]|uniref:hypothetical protein n=1 Tax=Myxococcus sp. AB036A TaxID=2562793 RepID=UPI0011474CD2|nr:hypothetical protein [Myxococcus sp. AB036A]
MWLWKEGEDWHVRLQRPGGVRWGLTLLLLLWSVGWLATTGLGLSGLFLLGSALLRPVPLVEQAPLDITSSLLAVPAALFVLGWVLAWIPVGAYLALSLVRAVSQERLSFNRHGVTRRFSWGPWRRRLQLRYSDMGDLYLSSNAATLTALLPTGASVTVATCGTPEQHRELWARMHAFCELGTGTARLARLVPQDREVEPLPDGGEVLRKVRWERAVWACVWWVAAALLGAGALLLVWRQRFDEGGFAPAFLAVVLGALAWLMGLRGWRTLQAREEWEIRRGGFVRAFRGLFGTQRLRHRVTEFEVQWRPDEEGSGSFVLWLRSPDGDVVLKEDTADRRPIEHLGVWLAHRACTTLRWNATAPAPQERLRDDAAVNE